MSKDLKSNLIHEVSEAFDDICVELCYIRDMCTNGENGLEDVAYEISKLLRALT